MDHAALFCVGKTLEEIEAGETRPEDQDVARFRKLSSGLFRPRRTQVGTALMKPSLSQRWIARRKISECEHHFLRFDFPPVPQLHVESSVTERDHINRFLPDARKMVIAPSGFAEQIFQIVTVQQPRNKACGMNVLCSDAAPCKWEPLEPFPEMFRIFRESSHFSARNIQQMREISSSVGDPPAKPPLPLDQRYSGRIGCVQKMNRDHCAGEAGTDDRDIRLESR